MPRRKIATVEEWEEFLRSCLYGGKLNGPCRHPRRTIENCVVPETCPRVKQQKAKGQAVGVTWRLPNNTGYYAWLENHDQAFRQLLADADWMYQVEESIPGINVVATMYKAREYWRSRRAWEKKVKRTRTKKLDWKTTYDNACRQEWNQIWQKENNGLDREHVRTIMEMNLDG